MIFHDVDLIPLDIRNIYGCSIEGPRHLSSNLQQWRFLLPYEDLFGGVIAISDKDFKSVNGFSNEYFGMYIFRRKWNCEKFQWAILVISSSQITSQIET